jgi:hypothetical protein
MTPTREDLLRLAACLDAMGRIGCDHQRAETLCEYARAAGLAAAKIPAAASLHAPDAARPFAVGDRVRIVCADGLRTGETGVIVADDGTSVPLRVEFNDGTRNWFLRTDVVSAPDAEARGGALSEGDAKNLEYVADEMVASDGWGDFPKTLRETASRIRATLANGAGEVERLLAERNAAREECLKRGEALLDMGKERDQLRAELDEARRERDAWQRRHDERIAEIKAERDEAIEERDVLRAYDTARQTSSGLADTIADRDRLRKKLDDTERVLATCRSDSDAWRDWAETLLPMVEWYSDDHARRLLDAKLAAAKAGAGVTERDVEQLRFMTPYLSTAHERYVTGLADRLSQLVQSREETGRND